MTEAEGEELSRVRLDTEAGDGMLDSTMTDAVRRRAQWWESARLQVLMEVDAAWGCLSSWVASTLETTLSLFLFLLGGNLKTWFSSDKVDVQSLEANSHMSGKYSRWMLPKSRARERASDPYVSVRELLIFSRVTSTGLLFRLSCLHNHYTSTLLLANGAKKRSTKYDKI